LSPYALGNEVVEEEGDGGEGNEGSDFMNVDGRSGLEAFLGGAEVVEKLSCGENVVERAGLGGLFKVVPAAVSVREAVAEYIGEEEGL